MAIFQLLSSLVHFAPGSGGAPNASALWRSWFSNILARNSQRLLENESLADSPDRLLAISKPLCTRLLAAMDYPGAPELKAEAVEDLLMYMYRRAVKIGLPLNTPLSSKGFRLGYSMGLFSHPRHPLEVQGYVGLFTWIVVQYDDIVGQDNDMMEDAMLFQRRFFNGEPQGNPLLEGMAELIREAHNHFDPVLANLLQVSALKFLSANLLERHEGFEKMEVTRDGIKFPDFLRDLAGINVAYAVFCYPKAMYPDVNVFLEAFPDMMRIIDIANDVLSFYKEELGGDMRNYIHNRALTTGKPLPAVLEDTLQETIDCAKRVDRILAGKGIYHDTWKESVRGYIAMHTTNPRYKFKDMGLSEVHPLTPFEGRIDDLFESMTPK
ncbi:Trichodiene synthase (TRI5) [Geosmithia morbida]|uniref:Trichodiene synthase (TRI5) n=1 Tax=Geosmithia morbida TaxID=1094350 RepID=A0A9P4YME0_9HYPO|nr:Trichodiene synthase (TRI5) [Geosmithia morbida]KAF4119235.1 Trichodiene synthase (TRI5) [Geosmithia morbida]